MFRALSFIVVAVAAPWLCGACKAARPDTALKADQSLVPGRATLAATPELEPLAEDRPVFGNVCCQVHNQRGYFYKTAGCSGETAAACCGRVWPNLNAVGATYQKALGFACDDVPDSAFGAVSVCRGATLFGETAPGIGDFSDFASRTFQVAHAWIKTPNMERGMGPNGTPPVDPENPDTSYQKVVDFLSAKKLRDMTQMTWVDHTGFSDLAARQAQCAPLALCDLGCVERSMNYGADLKTYTILNQCHIAAVRVLRGCGCFNHCTKRVLGACVKRIFPELRGLGLVDAEGTGGADDWREDYLINFPETGAAAGAGSP